MDPKVKQLVLWVVVTTIAAMILICAFGEGIAMLARGERI